MRFVKKRPQNRYVRPVKNYQLIRTVAKTSVEKEEKTTESGEVEKITEDKNMDSRIAQINQVLDPKKGSAKRVVKVEKKSQGLYERTEDSKVLITEDNKMLLND